MENNNTEIPGLKISIIPTNSGAFEIYSEQMECLFVTKDVGAAVASLVDEWIGICESGE